MDKNKASIKSGSPNFMRIVANTTYNSDAKFKYAEKLSGNKWRLIKDKKGPFWNFSSNKKLVEVGDKFVFVTLERVTKPICSTPYANACEGM